MNRIEAQKAYAKLLIEMGLQLKEGQPLTISAPVEAQDFIPMVVDAAYDAGASIVQVFWRHGKISRATLERAREEDLLDIPDYVLDQEFFYAKKGGASLHFTGDDPELLTGLDPQRLQRYNKARSEKLKPFMEMTMNDEVPWNVAAYPTLDWAKKVFPDAENPVDELWDAILYASRVTEDAVGAWREHLENLDQRAQWLNKEAFSALHYTNSLGTDLTIGLPKGHIWAAASSTLPEGGEFVANIPTEEVFTSPEWNRINGVVYSSMPLIYGGQPIDQFSLTFEDGKVVAAEAKVGNEILQELLNTDDGSRYLGEVALVPYDSPISNLKMLFYNTLFDENAACHLALGKAYPTTIEGGTELEESQLREHGINHSLVHEDFMVGTSDLNIDGIREDGSVVPVFRSGNWAQ
ncbi:MAG: aminopeptidase [Tissierellia bacterium]|nr:aminopeptidase [Tissierellia bacterium]